MDVFDRATALTKAWAAELGTEKPMERKGEAVEDERPLDEDDHVYELYVEHRVPTAENVAIQIWNAAVKGDTEVFKLATEAKEMDAALPGRQWQHGPIRIPLTDILKGVTLSGSPQVATGIEKGYIEAPFSDALSDELWAAHCDLRGDHPAYTRPLNAAGRFLDLIRCVFQNGKL